MIQVDIHCQASYIPEVLVLSKVPGPNADVVCARISRHEYQSIIAPELRRAFWHERAEAVSRLNKLLEREQKRCAEEEERERHRAE
jgi:hypothetical protein